MLHSAAQVFLMDKCSDLCCTIPLPNHIRNHTHALCSGLAEGLVSSPSTDWFVWAQTQLFFLLLRLQKQFNNPTILEAIPASISWGVFFEERGSITAKYTIWFSLRCCFARVLYSFQINILLHRPTGWQPGVIYLPKPFYSHFALWWKYF